MATKTEILFPVEKVPMVNMTKGLGFNPRFTHAIVGDIKGKKVVLNICSKSYTLVKNEDIILPFEKALGEQFTFDTVIRERGNSRFYIDYIIKDELFTIARKDKISPRVRVHNSYDGRLKFHLSYGFFRQVCSNGMVVGEKLKNLNLMHTEQMAENYAPSELVEGIQGFLDQAKDLIQPYIDLNNQKVTNVQDRVMEVIEETKFPTRQAEEVLARIEAERKQLNLPYVTDWLVFNGFNFQLNHNEAINMDEHKKEKVDFEVLTHLLGL